MKLFNQQNLPQVSLMMLCKIFGLYVYRKTNLPLQNSFTATPTDSADAGHGVTSPNSVFFVRDGLIL